MVRPCRSRSPLHGRRSRLAPSRITGIVWPGTAPIGTELVSLVYAPWNQSLLSLVSLERK